MEALLFFVIAINIILTFLIISMYSHLLKTINEVKNGLFTDLTDYVYQVAEDMVRVLGDKIDLNKTNIDNKAIREIQEKVRYIHTQLTTKIRVDYED